MEQGKRYDEACIEAGYHHSQLIKPEDIKLQYLPPFYSARDNTGKLIFNEDLDIPRNPVVLRALNQARKVCNALIKQYGAPYQVNIEMARDLSRPFDERRKIQAEQEVYRDRNQTLRNTFNETFNTAGELKGRDFEKWQLYEEQQCKCAYSLQPLDLPRLFDLGYVEVDHALPYSRSFDDSKNNRVLVLVAENRNKGNQTPFEYLDGKNNSARWHAFEVAVNSNKSYRQAKRSRLLRKEFGAKESEEFKDRNLNDTRYICKFFKNYVEQNLQLAENSEVKRCVVLSGQMTAFLRNRWGLTKVREESDRHHALDAAVVADCSHGMVKRLSDYSRRKEVGAVREGFVDVTTGEIANPVMHQQLKEHFPEPWLHFRDELKARREFDDIAQMQTALANLGTYSEEELANVKPLFVSRAPQRHNGGELHEAKIRSLKIIDSKQKSYIRVPLTSLTLKSLDSIIEADGRNKSLVDALTVRLNEHGGDAKKAFKLPFYKPSNDEKVAPLVKAVKISTTQRTGILVRGGVADLGTMKKLNVYFNNDRYIFQPEYQALQDRLINKSVDVANADFLFSLTKNDYVRLTLKGASYEGYFVMYESDGRLNLRSHDQPLASEIGYFRKSISDVKKIEKLNVDVLGRLYARQKEPRRGLA